MGARTRARARAGKYSLGVADQRPWTRAPERPRLGHDAWVTRCCVRVAALTSPAYRARLSHIRLVWSRPWSTPLGPSGLAWSVQPARPRPGWCGWYRGETPLQQGPSPQAPSRASAKVRLHRVKMPCAGLHLGWATLPSAAALPSCAGRGPRQVAATRAASPTAPAPSV